MLYPGGEGTGVQSVWHDYIARNRQPEALYLEAKVAAVQSVEWRPDDLVDIGLVGSPDRYLASPVGQGDIIQEDEVQEGDIAMLIGHYLIVAEREGENQQLHMTNYLRVSSM